MTPSAPGEPWTDGADDGPLVTAVVVGTSRPGLDISLRALLAQDLSELEVLVVAAAPPEQHVSALVAEDPRVRVVAARGGAGAMRDLGAARARGRYLTFLRPGDELPADALRLLVGALEDSGSDFAFGALVEAGAGRGDTGPRRDPAHLRTRTAVSLETLPEALTDTAEENRVYRTAFWRAAGLAFSSPRPAAGPALTALLSSTRFDVLADPTCVRPTDPAGGADSDVAGRARGALHAWLAAVTAVREALTRRDRPAVAAAWAGSTCDTGAVAHLDAAHQFSDDEWQELRGVLDRVRALLPDAGWRRVRAESRTKVWLALQDRRTTLERFVALRDVEGGNQRTTVAGGRVFAEFEGLEEVPVPSDCLELSEVETALAVHLHRVRRVDPDRYALTVFTRIPFVDLGDEPPLVEVSLTDADRRTSLALPLTLGRDPQANTAGHRYQDYAAGAAEVLLDLHDVARAWPTGSPILHLEVTMAARGVRRSGGLTSRETRTSPGPIGPVHVPPGSAAGRQVVARADHERQLVLGVRDAPAVALVTARSSGRVVTGVLAGLADGTLHARSGDVRAAAPLAPSKDGTATFRLVLPATGPHEPWRLTAGGADGVQRPVGFPVLARERFLDAADDADVLVARAARGLAEVVDAVTTLVVTGVEPRGDVLEVRGHWLGRVPHRWRLTVEGRVAVAAEGMSAGADLVARVPTVVDAWGLGESCVPPGLYDVRAVATGPEGSTQPVLLVIGDAMADQLLRFATTERLRVAPVRTASGLGVTVQPPLRDDERGQHAQHVLQRRLVTAPPPVDGHVVYFQSYTGEHATDSPRALSDELRRTRPDLTLYWGVASFTTLVPEGTVPVLIRSREWHRVLASAKYLVSNIDLDHWFTRRAEQRLLHTTHGYPAKAMGIPAWRSKGLSPARIALQLADVQRNWTLLLMPAPEMDVHYREAFGYTGPIEHAGYPRDDALLGGSAGDIRARTRRLLDVGEGRTAVLYAPTWREEETTGSRSARLAPHLDLAAASEGLGEEFVILLRGHRFHAREAQRAPRGSAGARIVDVTDYPEINDLVLASDAAVLDYSSLRFDFSLTGRPMVFLVPDLDRYRGGRGFFHPFEESAPGPWLRTTTEVVAALQDLPGVAARHAGEYAAFQRRFNYLQDGRAAQRVAARFFR